MPVDTIDQYSNSGELATEEAVQDEIFRGIDCEQFGETCAACNVPLSVPWIRCVGCQPRVDICSQCFSYGTEFAQHESDHPYTVVNFSFPVFEVSWTAAEELQLLDAIQEFGIGNWQAVSQRLRTKTEKECECHYLRHYVENPDPALPEFPDSVTVDNGAPVVFKLSDNPPRPAEGSSLWTDMAGYSAARNDFNVEHDNFVEMDVCQLTTDDDLEASSETESRESDCSAEDRALIKELKLTVVDVYRNCLKERQRRKKIIRDYGLINLRKWFVFLRRRFETAFSANTFRPFMRLFPPDTYDQFLESFNYEKQLKLDISRLQEYRREGIQRLHTVKWYRLMKQRREAAKNQRGLLTGVLNLIKDEMSCQAWLAKQAALGPSAKLDQPLPNAPRKAAPPLYIEELPSYEKLNANEKELCANVRLVPEAYLNFSKILIADCQKNGSLRLAQARTLIKIDVNKTRKLYDFLLRQDLINKDPL